ncbi:hypothetical protein O3W44_05210 [Pantoea sp. LMR881]|uniref:hypothetical protein n=1 Tax=Pantoea sp. LMR881 TaxID=3014336 RepID=UPI0022AF6436|nr:hypothetical protein [Pantoea sp. LMR881]MCZ4058599.1 hypothetical protein [Pantoea sp. LMR881]
MNNYLIPLLAPSVIKKDYAFAEGNIAFVIADKLSVQKRAGIAHLRGALRCHGA